MDVDPATVLWKIEAEAAANCARVQCLGIHMLVPVLMVTDLPSVLLLVIADYVDDIIYSLDSKKFNRLLAYFLFERRKPPDVCIKIDNIGPRVDCGGWMLS